MTDPKGTWSDGGKVWNGEPMQGATICPHCHATVLSTSQPERSTLEAMAETIHKARWPADRKMDITPFADEDKNGREYCFRIARAALAATPAEPAATPVVGGERKALEIGRQEIVLTIAFLGRDNGTHRMPNNVQSLIKRLAIADKAILAALRAPPASPLRGRDSERCPTCHHTDEEYAAGDWTCADPWHADDHLRAKSASPPEQPAAGLLEEGIEILDNLLASIRKHGNYSAESTITFIDQSLQCFRAAAPKPWIDAGEGDMP